MSSTTAVPRDKTNLNLPFLTNKKNILKLIIYLSQIFLINIILVECLCCIVIVIVISSCIYLLKLLLGFFIALDGLNARVELMLPGSNLACKTNTGTL